MRPTKPTIVVAFSGGLDSSVLLKEATLTGADVVAFSVNYGQRHEKELEAAKQIAKLYRVDHFTMPMSTFGMVLPGSALTDRNVKVPEGHYADPTMKKTVVPCRNLIFAALAGAICAAQGGGEVWLGAHAGDRAIYPDCRPDFISAAHSAVKLSTEGRVSVRAPYIDITKADIVRQGHGWGIPFGLTWSCYEGNEFHCGVCGTCVERREAFELAGVEDPTQYQNGRS